MGNIQNYQEFLKDVQLIDQTYLIDTILKQDKHLNHFNNIFNMMEYKLSLSDGEFIGSDYFLDRKREDIICQIEKIKQMLAENLPAKDQKELSLRKSNLEVDLNKLEEITGRERPVFYWYLVPYWQADMLINMGEVVFRGYFCHWWGVSSLEFEIRQTAKENIFLALFQKILS